jgi:hypothetical protein
MQVEPWTESVSSLPKGALALDFESREYGECDGELATDPR